MAFECKSLICEEGLAKTLQMLETVQAALESKEEEVQRLTKQNEKLKLCIEDYKGAELESHDMIVTLKDDKVLLLEQVKVLTQRNNQLDKALRQSRQQVAHQEHHVQDDKTSLLKQQLKAYQEDFDAERREKERLMVEKQNERLRLQAEITSLQLQLDRCRTELSHYSSEATRLAHQLKIRNQVEQEQYRRSLESKGYVPRSCDNGLPPLDPYVEVDTEFLDDPTPMGNGHAKKPPSPHIARCVPDKTGDQSPVCTRCARRFVQWAELEDHKMKCLQY